MTEKRFYLMNVEDPLHEYGRWCKPVLEDGETGKQYEGALEVMDLLNALYEENQELKCDLNTLQLQDEDRKAHQRTLEDKIKRLKDRIKVLE